MSGLELAAGFYERAVSPLLGSVPHAAALLGDGSEVLGFDDSVSTDHDFGPRVQLFLPPEIDPAPVHTALAGLPASFDGYPVAFADNDRFGGQPHHQVEVNTAGAFFAAHLGMDPAAGMGLADWLVTPTQRLANLTGGAVFHDPFGEVAVRRAALSWYPDDVWRYVLAAGWLRVGQQEAFVGRTGATGDELGSRLVAATLVRDIMRLAMLIERRWAPYPKWFGRAFAQLLLADALEPHLRTALAASDWRDREAAISAAASLLGTATNQLRLAAAVDSAPRRFYTRDIQVLGADRFTQALTDAITAADVRALLDQLRRRPGTTIGALPGAIDQVTDSTDILSHPHRCRAAATLLGP